MFNEQLGNITEATVMQHEQAALSEITKAQYIIFRST